MLFHFQHVWGPVTDGHQYCTKCGLARSVTCEHIWEQKGSFDVTNVRTNNVMEHVTILRCAKCGELKEFRSGVNPR